jgi:hypothetical protein
MTVTGQGVSGLAGQASHGQVLLHATEYAE